MNKTLDFFGPQIHTVLSHLTRKGRQTLQTLSSSINSTQPLGFPIEKKLTVFQIKEALVILIQHDLVSYASTQVRDRIVTFYCVREENVQLMHRYAWYLDASLTLFGSTGVFITSLLLTHGKLTKQFLLSTRAHLSTGTTNTNSETDTDINNDNEMMDMNNEEEMKANEDDISNTFNQMLTCGYIKSVDKMCTQTEDDVRFGLEAAHVSKLAHIVTANERIKIRKEILSSTKPSSKRKIVHDIDDLESSSIATLTSHSSNYNDNNSNSNNKKQKTQPQQVHHYSLSFSKFHVFYRNREIVRVSGEMFGGAVGSVVDACVKRVEGRMIGCRDEIHSAQFTLDSLQPLITTQLHVNNTTFSLLHHHLSTLSTSSPPLLTLDSSLSSGTYSIPLHHLGDHIKTELILKRISEVFGSNCARIWRVLSANGKLDDKQIANFAMLSLKDAREGVYELFKRGYTILQNVPKSTDYSRCFHLNDISLPQTTQILLKELTKQLQTLSTRHSHLFLVHRNLIEKLKRCDVQGDEELLSIGEREERKKMEGDEGLLRGAMINVAKEIMCMSEY